MDQQRCGHPTKNEGGPCPTPIALCSNCGHCRTHCDYTSECDYTEEEVQASRSKGAQAKNRKEREDGVRVVDSDSVPEAPESLEDAQKWAAWAAVQAATGNLDAKTARVTVYAVRAFKDVTEKVDLQERVEALEDELAEAQRGGLEAV